MGAGGDHFLTTSSLYTMSGAKIHTLHQYSQSCLDAHLQVATPKGKSQVGVPKHTIVTYLSVRSEAGRLQLRQQLQRRAPPAGVTEVLQLEAVACQRLRDAS